MADPLSATTLFSIGKDITLTGALLWALRGVFKREWVPGVYYFDQCKRAETAENERRMAVEAADRTIRANEELIAILKERGR